VGRRLLEALVDEARTWDGVERLTLTVVERAEAARRLYAAAGFETFGREPDAFRRGAVRDAALHLARALDARHSGRAGGGPEQPTDGS
jgi:RimJ/RimL family protein N-acetyltransferase